MKMNNNITNLNLKVKCGLFEKSFFGEFLSKQENKLGDQTSANRK